MEATILRSKVFEILQSAKDSSQAFDLVWITADRRRGTGGEIISAEQWMVVSGPHQTSPLRGGLASAQSQLSEDFLKNIEPPKIEAGAPVAFPKGEGRDGAKDPDHPENGTINVFNPANSGVHPHKVHFDLIQFFNGKRVLN